MQYSQAARPFDDSDDRHYSAPLYRRTPCPPPEPKRTGNFVVIRATLKLTTEKALIIISRDGSRTLALPKSKTQQIRDDAFRIPRWLAAREGLCK